MAFPLCNYFKKTQFRQTPGWIEVWNVGRMCSGNAGRRPPAHSLVLVRLTLVYAWEDVQVHSRQMSGPVSARVAKQAGRRERTQPGIPSYHRHPPHQLKSQPEGSLASARPSLPTPPQALHLGRAPRTSGWGGTTPSLLHIPELGRVSLSDTDLGDHPQLIHPAIKVTSKQRTGGPLV